MQGGHQLLTLVKEHLMSMATYGDCMEKGNNSEDVASGRWNFHSEGE